MLTTLRVRQNGSPRSLAKDQVIRDAAAKQPIALQNSKVMIMTVMMIAPTVDPVAYSNMRMKSGVVEVVSFINSSISGALNSTETSMPRARHPLIPRLKSMERATSVLAFLTSSDIFLLR